LGQAIAAQKTAISMYEDLMAAKTKEAQSLIDAIG